MAKTPDISGILETNISIETEWALMDVQPTIGGYGSGTVIVHSFYWRRQGENVEIKGSLQVTVAGTGISSVGLSGILSEFPIIPAPVNPSILGGSAEVVGHIDSYQWQTAGQFKRLAMTKSNATEIGFIAVNSNTSIKGADLHGGGGAVFIKYQVTGWEGTQTIKEQIG